MKCRFCSQDRTLVKAHIIPSGFFRRMLDGGDLRLLSEDQKVYPKKAPIGEYDTAILCADCDQLFGKWDDYAQQILSREPPGTPKVFPGGKVVGYELSQYRYDPLKLFFISLLWRAAVSTRSFYQKVKLGPYECVAKKLLENQDPGGAQEFAVLLARFDDHVLAEAVIHPFREKVGGINYSRFYLGGYVAYIKSDQRNAQREFSDLILAHGQPLRIIAQDLKQRHEFSRLHRIMTAPQNRV